MKPAPLPFVVAFIACTPAFAQDWKPARGPLMTRWAQEVSPTNVLPEYPRPQLVRARWLSLNGLWDYAIQPKDAAQPKAFDGQILVPFPVESALSGVMKPVGETQRLWYRRTFDVPADWRGQHILLNFEAVDWETTVYLNGRELGTHRGGYDPFTLNITDALRPNGPQELIVAVFDPTDAGPQPRGKQVRKPESIWYTSTTGIWQTVWLEPVPASYIANLHMTPDIDRGTLVVEVETEPAGAAAEVVALAGKQEIARNQGSGPIELKIPQPHLWSPADPFLYDLRITLRAADGKPLDEVTSYAGLRKISLGPDDQGRTRLLLNNKPLFMFGFLDQGFWPDGLYTAPTDAALRSDIELTLKLGYNLARKHVKVEPRRWYTWCDRLGLLVWQDMPSGDASADPGPEIQRTPASTQQYELEYRRLIESHFNHPSIVMWVPFNEGWGQFDTQRIVDLTHQLDPTRLVDSASGWHDLHVGDVCDIHDYPGPAAPTPEPKRAAVLGEFGGLGLPLADHTWQSKDNWGYRRFEDSAALTAAYLDLVSSLRLLAAERGLSAAVYTQTTDCEIEVNGMLTYDRAVVKMDADRIAAANRKLYAPPPKIVTLVPTSEESAQTWRYTTEPPAEDWAAPTFDDRAWSEGPAGFGRDGTPGITVRTPWQTPEIWLRRMEEIDPDAPLVAPHLRLYHDEDCEVYLNGRQVAQRRGFTTSYVLTRLENAGALRTGKNTLAIHCRQTQGGQGVDAGLVDVREPK